MISNVLYTGESAIHVVEVGFCTEVVYAHKHKKNYEQYCTLSEHLRNASYVNVQLHLLIFGEALEAPAECVHSALKLTILFISHSKVDSLGAV